MRRSVRRVQLLTASRALYFIPAIPMKSALFTFNLRRTVRSCLGCEERRPHDIDELPRHFYAPPSTKFHVLVLFAGPSKKPTIQQDRGGFFLPSCPTLLTYVRCMSSRSSLRGIAIQTGGAPRIFTPQDRFYGAVSKIKPPRRSLTFIGRHPKSKSNKWKRVSPGRIEGRTGIY
jgi:hypothetical protein